MKKLFLISLFFVACVNQNEENEKWQKIIKDSCDRIFECDCKYGYEQKKETCEIELGIQLGELLGIASLNNLEFNWDCIDSITYDFADNPCDIDFYNWTIQKNQNKCSIIYGDKKVGEECIKISTKSSNCENELSCIEGICVDEQNQNLGDPCEYKCSNIEHYCSYEDDKFICVQASKLNEPCEKKDCMSGLFCDEGFCHTQIKIGDNCKNYYNECEEKSFCENSKCTVFPTLGEKCDFQCEDRYWCSIENSICVEQEPVICKYE